MSAQDANGRTTEYGDYDSSGYPKLITDADRNETDFVYNSRGMVTTVTDAYEKDTTQEYDLFGRPGKRTEPKDEDKGDFITTPAPVYDANDNVKVATAPNGAVYTATYDAGDQLETSTEPKDKTGDSERKSVFTYDKVGNLKSETEPKGTLTTTDPDDFVTRYDYDEIYQLISVTNADGDEITYGYDNVGNLKTVVDPRKNASEASDDFATKYTYNLNHQVTVTTDADGHTTGAGYDHDGLVTSTTDQDGNQTIIELDERGRPSLVRVPHKNDSGIVYHTTKYVYDEVGNTTKVISPRGVDTPEVDDDFVTETVYDKLNRVKEQLTPYKPGDPDYHSANKTTYNYDKVGRLEKVLAPPSAGDGATTNDTTFTYFDNGWTKTSTDPWDITTVYDYTDLGQQLSRTLTAGGAAGDDADRAMSWTYFPDGKLATRSDDGVPAGAQIVLADNSDTQNITKTGTWTTSSEGSDHQGTDYSTHAAGAGTDAFTWELKIPQDGTYQVYVKYPNVTGAASSAAYTVTHATGTAPKTVNQTTNTGSWVSLGSYTFDEDKTTQKISLAQNATGVVAADAIKLVRDRSGDPADDEKASFEYSYDPNGNLTDITDLSPKTAIGAYKVTYDGLNQVKTVEEKASQSDTEAKHTTSFGYDENGNPKTRTHDGQPSAYDYDNRDLLSKVTDKKSASDTDPKVSSFTYTSRGEREQETKGNGNTVEYTYYLDGLLKHQLETKPNGTVVTEHTLTYDPNGNRKSDVAVKMNADNHAAKVATTSDYTYDPLDRIATVTKTGAGAATETYKHDANNNVITQTIKGVETSYDYQRNRLQSATTGGVKASYNYDPFGRLDTVTAQGKTLERYVYDGFDRISQYRKLGETGSTSTTNYTYDPLDRTASKTVNAGATGEKTTTYDYLALTDQVLTEAVGGEVTKSYQYSPWGERLSQVTHKAGEVEEDGYYGYSPHTDVETLTDDAGDTKATYGYTAYGNNDDAQFTGIDKPDTQDPTKEPYNPYRYTAKRWDSSSATYDMGFRDYSPGLNRFLSRDSYNGALADMNLVADPFTGNRYAFAGGNPITMVDPDGHEPLPSACAGSDMVECRNFYYGGEIDDGEGNTDLNTETAANLKWRSELVYAPGVDSSRTTHPEPIAASDDPHDFFDTFALFPGPIGMAAGGANCGLYAKEGAWTQAGLSCGAAALGGGPANAAVRSGIRRAGDEAAAAANSGSALAGASRAAFAAADDAGSIFIKNKHLASAGGRQAKFASNDISEVQGWVAEGQRSEGATFLPNDLPGTFRVVADMGRTVGTKGQTSIRAIVTDDGRVINAFPVNVR
ncbi:golvesin C-terminal-like domain-containing protein [Actinopolymorpha pittospori]